MKDQANSAVNSDATFSPYFQHPQTTPATPLRQESDEHYQQELEAKPDHGALENQIITNTHKYNTASSHH